MGNNEEKNMMTVDRTMEQEKHLANKLINTNKTIDMHCQHCEITRKRVYVEPYHLIDLDYIVDISTVGAYICIECGYF